MSEEKVYCPSCNYNELEKPLERNSLSRKDNKTYICSSCGTREALEEYLIQTNK